MKGLLILSNGQRFEGQMLTAETTVGEVVFNTGMTGYQEVFTDPSYCGQIITLTYPLIGNYGVFHEIEQSRVPYAAGYIMSELCEVPNNWQNEGVLATFIRTHHIPCLYDVDTRAITRAIRKEGVMKGAIVPVGSDEKMIRELMETHLETQLIRQVTTKEVECRGDGTYHVAVLDYGVKENIIKSLMKNDCRLTIFPADTKAEDVLAVKPDGIFLANGPGDPKDAMYAVAEIKKLLGKVPVFGICMGLQLLGLALGGNSIKLRFGHRGSNHPVKDLQTGRVYITSQNHGYAIDEKTLPDTVVITHKNLNDGTLEGFTCPSLQVKAVQYHPEASPGPTDNLYLFTEFIAMMEGK